MGWLGGKHLQEAEELGCDRNQSDFNFDPESQFSGQLLDAPMPQFTPNNFEAKKQVGLILEARQLPSWLRPRPPTPLQPT